MNGNKLLIVYSAVLTAACAIGLGTGAVANQAPGNEKAKFGEIDVQRINIREPDGTIRMVLSNTAQSPGIYWRNVERPHPSGRRSAGMLFFNDEGTENGGLSFSGRRLPDGSAVGGGHISFDQYEQDQVIQLTQNEQAGRRWAAMIVRDVPDAPLDFDLAQRITQLPEGPERTAAIQRVQAEGTFGRQRVYVGKTRDRESAVLLSDAMGRPRIRMRVAPDGASAIDFLDENGQVLRSLTPQS
ncbi:hypothetical protein RCO27_01885 [Sphingosinicella sp. LHD-64]|uniref:hypothetical protein n=1 Tax=Sphingosinicella sp. LHD-64 TaxID=3072139 RepID=UPI00280F3DA9|nr:hypothetical protein [Sphingosinicella sp. LHD-64]MDQ8754967.1 hypothetical protein [Sphingosinicella sp. LHD-64]